MKLKCPNRILVKFLDFRSGNLDWLTVTKIIIRLDTANFVKFLNGWGECVIFFLLILFLLHHFSYFAHCLIFDQLQIFSIFKVRLFSPCIKRHLFWRCFDNRGFGWLKDAIEWANIINIALAEHIGHMRLCVWWLCSLLGPKICFNSSIWWFNQIFQLLNLSSTRFVSWGLLKTKDTRNSQVINIVGISNNWSLRCLMCAKVSHWRIVRKL